MGKCHAAIIGAGPYGLSIAAHLGAAGVDFRIFGSPMHTWMTQMPQGMRLKSEGFASSLYDPTSSFTLAHYCKEQGIPYADSGLPVPLETFIAYGLEFQKRFVPHLEDKQVVSVERIGADFRLALSDGELVTANKVIVAAGISHFAYLPPTLAALPPDFVSHSSEHNLLDGFKGRDVAIVGAGASALDLAALLHNAGASVHLIARKPLVRFHNPPDQKPRTLLQRAFQPGTGIGSGWKLYFCAYMPWAFRYMPESVRLRAVRNILGPAPGWFIKDQVVGKFPFHLGVNITEAKAVNGKVNITIEDVTAKRETLVVDHVIAATGYRVDLQRLTFLDSRIQSAIESVEQTPVLSSSFESTMPGLYFVGTSAANTFGPLMRFAYGAEFAARRVAAHVAKSFVRKPSAGAVEKLQSMDRDHVGVR